MLSLRKSNALRFKISSGLISLIKTFCSFISFLKNLFLSKWVKGFAVFINKSQFEEIGYFDENFFLYFEEIDLCKRLIKNGKKIFFIPKALIKHSGGQSHSRDINNRMELNRNWHWMWSTFYFYKKHNGMFYAFIKIFTKLISSFFKVIFFTATLQNKKKEIYSHRLSGIINSIRGKNSWYRPNLD